MVAGTLDMHGVKKPMTLSFTPAFGKNGGGEDTWSYETTLKINRKDFGIGASSVAAKISLKDEVDLDLLLVGAFKAKEGAAEPDPAPAPKKVHRMKPATAKS